MTPAVRKKDGELTINLKPESVIRLPFLCRTAVSRIVSCFIEDVAGYTGKKQHTR